MEAFLAALARFTNRQGLPTTILLDNGSNFVLFVSLADLFNLSQLKSMLPTKSVISGAGWNLVNCLVADLWEDQWHAPADPPAAAEREKPQKITFTQVTLSC